LYNLLKHCRSQLRPLLVVCRLSKGQEVAVLAINGTEIVMDAQRRHKLAPTPLSALGRALMGALLMCVYRKADESLQLTFMGDGPLKSMQVIAESGGNVKGRVGNPGLELPLRPDGRVDVGGAVGKGAMLKASDSQTRATMTTEELEIHRCIAIFASQALTAPVFWDAIFE
jgi:redox-regulated HSP33 family molecular chaperone